jgi:hypothetical protein
VKKTLTAYEQFKVYHERVKQVQSLKNEVCTVSNSWWLKASVSLRSYLLVQAGVDDVRRFIDTPWRSLPDGLRDSIILNTKQLKREISGCGWL